MKHLLYILILLSTAISFAQKEFHVFPLDGKIIKGTPKGDGSLDNPWDLQTALSQSSERVKGGDIISIHKGIYKGRFVSKLNSISKDKYITVTNFKDDLVIIDGNVKANKNYVLQVKGKQVIYKNFTVTYLGNFSRIKKDKNYTGFEGVSHVSGENCKFQNLVIHNIPGLGLGTWKDTGGTIIEDCIIYNNGFLGVRRGEGEGIYVQNKSNEVRVIRNNIIFNNYYKGIEVWSASSRRKKEFVKNIDLEDNIIFNSGVPANVHKGNIIIASNDKEGINIAKHINVKGNILYHNVDFIKNNKLGNAASFTLGFIENSRVEDVTVKDNVIIGQNNAFNISHAKSAVIENNTIYTGYVHLEKSSLSALESGDIISNGNRYFTKNSKTFRISKYKDYKFNDWKKGFKIDDNSQWQLLKEFSVSPVLKLKKLNSLKDTYNVVLLDKKGNDVTVDFSNHSVEEGMSYKIYDIENPSVVVKSGEISEDLKITFPMGLKVLEMPLHNTVATKSADNFGVFRIEFTEKPKRKTFFGRLFGWLF